MIKITSLALVITATVALTACNPSEQTSAKTDIEQAPSAVSMANPASEYCVSLGGKLEINNEAEGQVGICHLPSGEKIEEWTLYRKANKQEVTTAIDMANPAATYCESLQGKLALDTGICTLPSGEALDQWELFRRDNKQTKPSIGLANPASTYCESLQGKLALDTGVCTLPSGEALDQWDLFRRDHKQTKPAIGMANPAAKYCESLQGKLALDTGICTLPSGEALDQWELFRRDHKQADPAKELLPITQ